MQKLRKHMANNAPVWVTCLVLSLIFVISMQPHIHVFAEHQHEVAITQHDHDASLHQAHFGNVHDAEHMGMGHLDHSTYAIDIFPEGVSKSSISILLVCILLSTLILLLPPPATGLLLNRRNEFTPLIKRCTALPPQLRAPPR